MVFLYGISGISKSELAKAYAKQHSKEYTNVLDMNNVGDLKQNMIDMDFAEDLPDESDDTRFKRHNRFLCSLREDTLLIAANFAVTREKDESLGVMLKCRCRILFTIRSRYENRISLETKAGIFWFLIVSRNRRIANGVMTKILWKKLCKVTKCSYLLFPTLTEIIIRATIFAENVGMLPAVRA